MYKNAKNDPVQQEIFIFFDVILVERARSTEHVDLFLKKNSRKIELRFEIIPQIYDELKMYRR